MDLPVDQLKHPDHNPVAYVLDRLARRKKIDGPLSPQMARIGQQIVDSAVKSARLRKTVPLIDR